MVDQSGKIPKYRSFGILTEPNNAKPNLIVDENKGFLLFDQFFEILLHFHVTNFFEILNIVIILNSPEIWLKNAQKDSVRYFLILPNRTE